MDSEKNYFPLATGEGSIVNLEERRTSRRRSVSSIENEVNAHAPSCLKRGSLTTSIWVLTSVSLGMGVFVQPKVVARLGYALGCGLIILFALITYYSQLLLLKIVNSKYEATKKQYSSYSQVSADLLGNTGFAVNCLTMTLCCLVANAGHFATVIQMLHDIICWYFTGSYDYPFTSTQRCVVLCLLSGFVLPFCISSNDLHSLRYISTTSVFVCVTLTLSVMFLACKRIYELGIADGELAVPAFNGNFGDILNGAAAICFAYSSVINIVSVNKDIQDTQQPLTQGARAIAFASSICGFCYASLSVVCVLSWGTLCSQFNGNVLYLIPVDEYWVTFWCFALVITLLYPVINVPMVDNLEMLIMMVVDEPDANESSIKTFLLRNRRAIISILGMLAVIVLDTFITDLADIFGLCGSLGLGTVSMILPATIALKHRHNLAKIHWLGAGLVLIVGLVITFGSSISIITALLGLN